MRNLLIVLERCFINLQLERDTERSLILKTKRQIGHWLFKAKLQKVESSQQSQETVNRNSKTGH
jgi:hypothetical protein